MKFSFVILTLALSFSAMAAKDNFKYIGDKYESYSILEAVTEDLSDSSLKCQGSDPKSIGKFIQDANENNRASLYLDRDSNQPLMRIQMSEGANLYESFITTSADFKKVTGVEISQFKEYKVNEGTLVKPEFVMKRKTIYKVLCK